jgi:hypothetical protein
MYFENPIQGARMTTSLDPIVCEFETDAQAKSYDQWFRAKVEQSLILADNPRTPRYSSDEVMRRVHASFKLEAA